VDPVALQMLSFTDQLQRTIYLPDLPRSIVSLVPSQTELLYNLGLEQEVTGITKFCVHPEPWFRHKQRVGGTKNVHPDIIHALHPDLIIANKEENVKEQVEALAQQYPVWISDVNTLEDAYAMIASIGQMTGTAEQASAITNAIQQGFDALPVAPSPIRTGYLIWKDPYMTIGHDTFIHNMLQRIGLHNVFGHLTRYPAIDIEALQQAHCQLLLLSSEPYPFKQKHIDELQQHLPDARIVLTDGEMFSWYGSRLLHAPAYFRSLLTSIR
jgi:ABC-type Fe3+-hydroxamate transport system substrate-binding protein